MRDITLGQYINGDSAIHRLDPRIRLILTLVYIILLFILKTIPQMLLALALILGAYALVRIPVKMLLKSLKPIIPIVVFTSVLNMFFVNG
ncbi:MAG: energy-coupling factor transporter transmembrane protein EcfT, partial [Oscillospiraceae bacterium]|nr:energy-coupling factor transporter transmembrane protein EcfT [Oscillospiraceae bacterium]